MVHEKTRWKWHQCLQARNDIISNDSECENDDYVKNTLITRYDQDLNEDNDDLYKKQKQLQKDVKIAFELSAKMAQMQVDVERNALNKNRSILYDFIGINANVNKPLSTKILEELNIGQLQVIVNDLYHQIEVNNNELINLLIERDSLSMEQDSILVDIEDLTRRLQERSIDQSKSSSKYVYITKSSQEKRSSIFQKLFSK